MSPRCYSDSHQNAINTPLLATADPSTPFSHHIPRAREQHRIPKSKNPNETSPPSITTENATSKSLINKTETGSYKTCGQSDKGTGYICLPSIS